MVGQTYTKQDLRDISTKEGYLQWLRTNLNIQTVGTSKSVKKSFVAGENINGGNAVIIDTNGRVYKFNIANPSHAGKFGGIADTSSLIETSCTITIAGECTNVGSGWTSGVSYYISSNSMLSPTPPINGIVHLVGIGSGTDKILINNSLEFETI